MGEYQEFIIALVTAIGGLATGWFAIQRFSVEARKISAETQNKQQATINDLLTTQEKLLARIADLNGRHEECLQEKAGLRSENKGLREEGTRDKRKIKRLENALKALQGN